MCRQVIEREYLLKKKNKEQANPLTQQASPRLIVGISSRALFDLDKSHTIYEEQGVEAYRTHQIDNENVLLEPGSAFHLVRKLLQINQKVASQHKLVEVVLLSRNTADTGLRVFNSIEAYDLDITRAAFCGGRSPFSYIEPFRCNLFLSANNEDVTTALQNGYAAARLLPGLSDSEQDNQLRIAFDGDSVLFSDESEQVFQKEGLESFTDNEKKKINTPLSGGPFKEFLSALHFLQQHLQDDSIRTALVTSRAAPTHKRVILTLRQWNIRLDESCFLGGYEKGEFLKSFNADVFFDDQRSHCQSAQQHVTTGHVPHGVANNDG